jgi:hypothetical protein
MDAVNLAVVFLAGAAIGLLTGILAIRSRW